jgi:hypothetical protein
LIAALHNYLFAFSAELPHMTPHRRLGRVEPAFPIDGTGCVWFLPFRFR